MSSKKSSSTLIPLIFFALASFFLYQFYSSAPPKKKLKDQYRSASVPTNYKPIQLSTKEPLGQKLLFAIKSQPDLTPYLSLIKDVGFKTQLSNSHTNDLLEANLKRTIPIVEKGSYGLEAHAFNSRIKDDEKIFLQLSIYELHSRNLIGELNIEITAKELQK